MTKHDFLARLAARLRQGRVEDIEEILAQYEEHFAYKLADGYSQEEIAAKLGDPEALALQFVGEGNAAGGAKGAAVAITAGTDIAAGLFFALLWIWAAVMAAFSIASAAVGACLAAGIAPYGLIPAMPALSRAAFAAVSLSLAILSAVGLIYFGALVRRLGRVYGRHRRGVLAGRGALPSAAPGPLFPARANRRLRALALWSLCAFAICFVLSYAISAVTAGSLEFWHVWNWFVR